MRVMLITSDQSAAHCINLMLAPRGAKPDWSPNVVAALNIVHRTAYDIILVETKSLDDGHEVARHLRMAGISTPLIILSTRPKESFDTKAVHGRVDDIIWKPFRPTELLERIEIVIRERIEAALIRRITPDRAEDVANARLLIKDKCRYFTPAECAILVVLMIHYGNFVTISALFEYIYEKQYIRGSRNIEFIVCGLRKRLEKYGAPGIIHTVRRRGYKLQEPTAIPDH